MIKIVAVVLTLGPKSWQPRHDVLCISFYLTEKYIMIKGNICFFYGNYVKLSESKLIYCYNCSDEVRDIGFLINITYVDIVS